MKSISLYILCRCSVYTARTIFSVEAGFRLSDDQYVGYCSSIFTFSGVATVAALLVMMQLQYVAVLLVKMLLQ